jgi:outer membrane autotransporter protein
MGSVLGLLSLPMAWAGYCVKDAATSTFNCYIDKADDAYLILSLPDYKININGFNGGYGFLKNPENSDPTDPINNLVGSGLVIIAEGNNVVINNFGRIYNDYQGPAEPWIRNGGVTVMWKGDDYPNGPPLTKKNSNALKPDKKQVNRLTGRIQTFINNKPASIDAEGTYFAYQNGYYGAGVAMFNAKGDTAIVENHGEIKLNWKPDGRANIVYLRGGNIKFTQSSTGSTHGNILLEEADTLDFYNSGYILGNVNPAVLGKVDFNNEGVIEGNITFSSPADEAMITLTNAGQITGQVNLSAYDSRGEFIVKSGSSVGGVTSTSGKLTLQAKAVDEHTYEINMNQYQGFSHLTVNNGQWCLSDNFGCGTVYYDFFDNVLTYHIIDLNGGTIYIPTSKVLNNAEIRITNGGRFVPIADMVLENTINAEGNLTLGGPASFTLKGDVTVTGGMFKNDESTLTLAGNNTYGENITLNNGALIIDKAVVETTGIVRGNGSVTRLELRGGTLRPPKQKGSTIRLIDKFLNEEVEIGVMGDRSSYFTIDSNGNDVTISSTLNGAGGLVKQGEGSLTIGKGKYQGDTEVKQGTLLTTDAGKLEAINTLTIGAEAAYILRPAEVLDQVNVKNILLGSGVLELNFPQSTRFYFSSRVGNAFAGKVQMSGGTFMLDNDATEVLSRASLQLDKHSFTSINADRSISKLILNGGTLQILTKDDDTFSRLYATELDAAGGGTLTLTPLKSIATLNATPPQHFHHVSLLDQNYDTGYQLVFAHTIEGVGSQLALVDQQGNPLTTTYTKGIVQDGVTKAMGTYNYLANVRSDGIWLGYGLKEINLQSGQTFTLSDEDAENKALSARLTGVGNLALKATKLAPLVLANASSNYTGSTTITLGTVQIGTHNALGKTSQLTILPGTAVDINGKTQTLGTLNHQAGGVLDVNGGNLTIAQGGNIAGVLQGKGNIRLSGGELKVQSNHAAFTGTTIATGTLTVEGKLGGKISILSGGRLQGRGRVGETTIASGATLAGSSNGTLTVEGNLVLDPGALFEANIRPDRQSELVHVTGSAIVNGQVSVLRVWGDYSAGQRYTLLSAEQGLTGTFSSITQNFPFIDLTITQDRQHIYLNIMRNSSDFDDLAPDDQKEEAGAIGGLGPGNPLYDAISHLADEAAYRRALNMLSGEIYASTQAYLLDSSRYLRDMTVSRMHNLPGSKEASLAPTTWVQTYGAWGHYAATDRKAALNHRQSGVFIGTDSLDENDWRVGMIGGYGQAKLNVNARNSHAKIEGYHLGLYSGIAWDNWNFRLGGAYSWYKVDTQRYPVIGTQNYVDITKYSANSTQFFGEMGYQVGETVKVEPFVNVAYVKAGNDAFKESPSITALAGESNKDKVVFSTLAIRASKVFATPDTELALQGNLGWRHASGRTKPATRLTFTKSTPFHTHGTAIAQDAAVVGVGIGMKTGKNVNIELNYAGLLNQHTQEHSAKMNMVWKF